ncbi:unnamed protein product [Urochloa humidicola]
MLGHGGVRPSNRSVSRRGGAAAGGTHVVLLAAPMCPLGRRRRLLHLLRPDLPKRLHLRWQRRCAAPVALPKSPHSPTSDLPRGCGAAGPGGGAVLRETRQGALELEEEVVGSAWFILADTEDDRCLPEGRGIGAWAPMFQHLLAHRSLECHQRHLLSDSPTTPAPLVPAATPSSGLSDLTHLTHLGAFVWRIRKRRCNLFEIGVTREQYDFDFG